jgi:hypothetical protein
LGASLLNGVNKSKTSLDKSINSLIKYLEQLKDKTIHQTKQNKEERKVNHD